MARPKSARKAADAGSAFLRFTADEYTIIKKALEEQSTGVIGGGTITVAAFAREVVLREALTPPIRKLLPGYRHDYFNVDRVVGDLGASEAVRYAVLSALREMATAGELGQHSATDFFVPRPKK